MHELSLSSAIIDTVLRHADGRFVSSVEMKIGRLRQVVPVQTKSTLSEKRCAWRCVGRDTNVARIFCQ